MFRFHNGNRAGLARIRLQAASARTPWLYAVLVLLLISTWLIPAMSQAQTAVVAPTFSMPRGFYTGGFDLTLSAAPGSVIRYTLNGNTPTDTSTSYVSPIPISTTTVVRAAAFNGTTRSAVVTHTYLFLDSVRTQSDTPPPGWPGQFAPDDINGTYPADYGMDPQVWNHSNNTNKMPAVMRSIPTISVVTDLPNLWNPDYGIYWNSSAKEGNPVDPFNNPVSQGKWERPTSIEWLLPDGSTAFAVNGGMRIHGQASRRPHRTPKRSFRFYFKSGYGSGSLEYALFNDPNAVTKFDRLVFRNGGNRTWPYYDRDQRREADYVNDEWARQAWGEMGHVTSHGTYAHLYLNGLYWGLYNVTERIDEKFLAAYYPGMKDTDFDLIESEEALENAAVASAGDMVAYNQLLELVRANETNPPAVTNAEYDLIKTRVDVISLADYFILNHYIGKTDWPDHNWNLYRARIGTDTRFKFVAWDNDSGLNKVTENTTLLEETPVNGYLDAPIQIFNRLVTNSEFVQVVTDRLYKHVIAPDGVLAQANCVSIYSGLSTIIDQAIIGESARWGDYSRDVYPSTNVAPKAFPAYLYSRDLPDDYTDPTDQVADDVQKTWVEVRDSKLNSYCSNRGPVVRSQYVTNNWYPDVAELVNPPGISQAGGLVPINNPTVQLNNLPNANAGTIYYTTDGSDPRAEYGAVAASALNGADAVSIPIERATTLKARVLSGTSWSPLLEHSFAPTQPLDDLVINEIHYNPAVPVTVPAQDPKQYEFIELYNRGSVPLQLDRLSFLRGVTYRFPDNTTIQPGQYLVLASNATIFQNRYGTAPQGVYTGSLANEGEIIELVDAVGNQLDRVAYGIATPWPAAPNGLGPSLSLVSAGSDNSSAAAWLASLANNGTPGQPNGLGVVIPQTPTISWAKPADITYGTALGATQLNATVSINSQPVAGSLSYTPAAASVLQAGANQDLTVLFTPDNPNAYSVVTATVKINVLKAPLTISAQNKSWLRGTTFPSLSVEYHGFVNNDTAASLDTAAVVTTTATTASPDGHYPITVGAAADSNYVITFEDGTLEITSPVVAIPKYLIRLPFIHR